MKEPIAENDATLPPTANMDNAAPLNILEPMHTTDTKKQFIELRAKGWSLARIAPHLHVSVRTLVDWNLQAQGEIRVARAVEVEALQEKILASHEDPPAIGLPDGSSSPGKRDFCTVFALFLPRFCIIFRKLLSFVTVRFEL